MFSVPPGSERFEEAVDYIEKHQLYDTALDIWKNTDRYEVCLVIITPNLADSFFKPYFQRILEIYGDWLYERREFRQAASGSPTFSNFLID